MKQKKGFFGFAASAVAMGLLLGATWAQAAVLNGSFENGIDIVGGSTIIQTNQAGIDSWVVEPAVEYVEELWQASEGSRSVDLQAFALEAGQITQVIDTIPGARYTVSFDLAGNPFGTGIVQMRASADASIRDFTFDVTGKSPTNTSESLPRD